MNLLAGMSHTGGIVSTQEKQKMNIIRLLAYPDGNHTSNELMKIVQQDLNLVKQKYTVVKLYLHFGFNQLLYQCHPFKT